MDFLKKVASEVENSTKTQSANTTESSGNGDNNGANSILGAINGALGGGEKGEKKEDYLDKAIDIVQEHVFKAGDQSNESALEQAKDSQIASAIRGGYKTVTGKDFPLADKSS